MADKPRILIPAGYYLPSVLAGGPVRSIANLVDHLGGEFDFRIIALDRDLGARRPYEGVRTGMWTQKNQAEVLYLSPAQVSIRRVLAAMSRERYDLLYVNSLFDPTWGLLPLAARRATRQQRRRAAIVAPRGQLMPGAIALKRWKKVPYLHLLKSLVLVGDEYWQATSAGELDDIRLHIGTKRDHLYLARNIPTRTTAVQPHARRKETGQVRVAFLSRVSRKKNLEGAINALRELHVDVTFDIFGPIEDNGYWAQCQQLISRLPRNVTATHHGPVEADRVLSILGEYDLFLLPSFGENHGHVIHEALLAGCPVLISDRTPWRDLALRRAGWDLPIDDIRGFRDVIERVARMRASEHEEWRTGARGMGQQWLDDSVGVAEHRTLLYKALGG